MKTTVSRAICHKPQNKMDGLSEAMARKMSFQSRREQNRADESTERGNLTVIGRGTCGTIYEIPGTDRVIKLGSPGHDGLWVDFLSTNAAYTGVMKTENSLRIVQGLSDENVSVPRVPRGFEYHIDTDDSFWSHPADRLPADEQGPKVGYIMERIWPVPEALARALIRHFFHHEKQAAAFETVNSTNSACLVRLYFGKNSPEDVDYDSVE